MSRRYFTLQAEAPPRPGLDELRPLRWLGMTLAHGEPGPGDRPLLTDDAKVLTALDQLLADAALLHADERPNGNADAVSDNGGHVPAYPWLRNTPQGALLDFEHVIRPTLVGRVAALSLSLGTSRYVTFDPAHAINAATRAVSVHHPVVVAAGNEGADDRGRETLSAWAQPPWVISVTATEDPEGGPVSPRSSVGAREDRTTWPTVVSYGASARDAGRFGTSFAAPRVARQLAVFSAFLDVLRATAAHVLGEPEVGAPLPVVHIVDKGLDVRSAAPTLELPATPFGVIDPERLRHALAGAGVRALPAPPARPELLRVLLLSSARSVEGEPHEIGHGFVDDSTTRERLLRFTSADALRALGIEAVPQAGDVPLAEADLIGPLLDVVTRSLLLQGADIDAFDNPIRPQLVATPAAPGPDSRLRLEALRGG